MIFSFQRKYFFYFLIIVIFLTSGSCAPTVKSGTSGTRTKVPATQKPYVIKGVKYYPIASSLGYRDTGIASWYGRKFHGRRTSNGERYNMYADTAAHKTLPMDTVLLVKNLENGREVVVRVNDRGPFVRGRIVDLSYGSAKKLGIIRKGTAKVRISALASSSDGNYLTVPNYQQGQFYIQIGSFQDKLNATRLKNRFIDAGHSTIISELREKGTTYYRVQVYVGTQLALARTAEKALWAKGYTGAFIIAR